MNRADRLITLCAGFLVAAAAEPIPAESPSIFRQVQDSEEAAPALRPVQLSPHTYPAKPIRMVVPLAPGGNADILARAVGQRMSENWGKPVVVDNRPGASGVIAAQIVAKSAPDGHTVFVVGPAQVAINPALRTKLPYDALRDFAPVSLGVVSPMLLVANPSFPVRTVHELIERAKSKPRAYSYASVGVGSPQHLAGELFKMITQTEIVHVPYKGGGPATVALLGGQEAQFGFVGMGPVLPHVKAGRLKVLGLTTTKRSPAVPDVPTLHEQGVTDFDVSTWSAFYVTAGTPRSVIARLNDEIARVLNLAEVRDHLTKAGLEVTPSTPEGLARFIKSEAEKYRRIIEVSGTKAD